MLVFMKRSLLAVFFLLSLSSAFAQGTRVYYVAVDGLFSAPGDSWAEATTLHKALSVATTGDNIFLKAGAYTPNRRGGELVDNPRNAVFELPNGALIYGGFEGTETGANAAAIIAARNMSRIATTNETIIEGNRGGKTSNDDNILRLFLLPDNYAVTLNGLTVSGGNLETGSNGSGLHAGEDTEVTVQNCRFIGGRAALGGAIYVGDDGMLTITSSTFEDNYANHGGAIYVLSDVTLSITGSTFEGNRLNGGGDGSAVNAREMSTVTIARCSFLRNIATTANASGTVFVHEPTSTSISNSLFAGNEAEDGSAIFVSGGGGGKLTNNTVYGNINRTTTLGAVTLEDATATWVIANNIVYGNTGMHEVSLANMMGKTLVNNLIEDNSIKNNPGTTGAVTSPASAHLIFESIEPTDANYLHLLRGSFAVNAGSDDHIDGATVDLAGNTRVVSPRVDVGAYESFSTAPSLRITNNDGELFQSSNNPLSAAAAAEGIQVVFAGMDVTGVSITEVSDVNDILTFPTTSLPSSPVIANFNVAANTTGNRREATITLTLSGADPAVSQSVHFVQERGGSITLYVAEDGDPEASGQSWATATTLQAAIDNYLSGDSLFVKRGTYTPTTTKSDGMPVGDGEARDATYILPDGIKIYGGFVGTETGADATAVLAAREMSRIFTTNATIIEGDIGTMRTEQASNRNDNIKRLFLLAAGGTTTLDGLTVARAFNEGNASANGSGLRAESGTNITLRNCMFIGHVSHDGGAIVVRSTAAAPATLAITDCIFENNIANTGGGVRIEEDGMLTATGSRFVANGAIFTGCCGGGALMAVGGASITVTNCTFERNTGANDGGAILVEPGGTLMATGSTFRENRANTDDKGPAIYLGSSNASPSTGTITRCSFIENSALGSSNGTVHVAEGATLNVSNSLFVGNSMNFGSAVYSDGSMGTFINNTVYDNRDRDAAAAPLTLRLATSTWLVANNIFYGNQGVNDVLLQDNSNKTIVNNLIEGTVVDGGDAVMAAVAAPALATYVFESLDPMDENYLRLGAGSAGRDAGNNDYIDGDVVAFEAADAVGLTDLGGGARIINTTVDLGAYEAVVSTAGYLFVDISGTDSERTALDTVRLASGASTQTLTIRYGGMGAMGVAVAETSDASNMLALGTPSGTTSPITIAVTVAANTTDLEQEAVLSFTLEGVTPSITQSIRFIKGTPPRTMATSIHVATDGDAEGDGLSWAEATTLQAALDNYIDGDVLLVKKGSYTPVMASGVVASDARDGTYVLPDGVVIYGGFAGTETGADAAAIVKAREIPRIHSTNATIIEGDIGTLRTEMEANDDDNVKRLFVLGENNEATLDGLTIARGYFGTDNDGAGIHADNGSDLTIRHCRFIGNKGRDGGGIFVDDEGELSITSSVFEGNYANFGAAVYMRNNSTLDVTSSTFEGNRLNGGGEGLAIFFRDNATGTVVSSSFLRNRGEEDSSGTLFGATGVTLHVSSSLFVGNNAEDGSTIWATGNGGTFINNTVYGNLDRTTTFGTLTLEDGMATWIIANNIIYDNATSNGSQVELSFQNSGNKTMTHNLIGRRGTRNAPPLSNEIARPSFLFALFLSTDPTDPNYLRLRPGASGIDAGSNDYIDGDMDAFEVADTMGVVDAAGNDRIVNTTVDLGAYEAPVSPGHVIVNVVSSGVRRTALDAVSVNNSRSTGTFNISYAGMGATGVEVTKTSDPSNLISVGTSSGSSPIEVSFVVSANTTFVPREAVLTFTLEGISPTISQSIRFTQPRAGGGLLRVAADGRAENDGLSWANATTLQYALDNSLAGDTIFIKKGSYTPVMAGGVVAPDARDGTYVLPNETAIYGGFAGDEATLADREMSLIATTNETIIEGNIGDRVDNTDNVKRLLFLPNDRSATLDGLTVARAYETSFSGAGVFMNDGAQLTIRDCRFIENVGSSGGAIYLDPHGVLNITSSTFKGNVAANNGGAIGMLRDAIVNITGSTFEENRLTGGGEGAAIELDTRTRATITRSSFLRNEALEDNASGTVFLNDGGVADISNCLFVGNNTEDGSAIWSEGKGGFFVNNTVYGNTDRTTNTDEGTVSIALSSSKWVIANNIIYGNDSPNEVRLGGGTPEKTMEFNLIEDNDVAAHSADHYRVAPPPTVLGLFESIDPESEGYLRLLPSSVGVNGGANKYIDGDVQPFTQADLIGVTDFAGNDRLVGTAVDVGAYEFRPTFDSYLYVEMPFEHARRPSRDTVYLRAGTDRAEATIEYTGVGEGVTITETSDPDNIISTSEPSLSSIPAFVNFDVTANASVGQREAILTFTIAGTTPPVTRVIHFIQSREVSGPIYVAPDGVSNASGMSWATATTLQSALENYAVGDTLLVKKGSYSPTRTIQGRVPTDPRDATFLLPDELLMYGGFAGTETGATGADVIAARTMASIATTNETIIEGNIGDLTDSTDNIILLLELAREDEAILDGFTIARGYSEEN